MKVFNTGELVRVTYDGATHYNEYGRILNRNGTDDYPNDYWVEFVGGSKAPYGDYELELVTEDHLQKLEETIRAYRDYLTVNNADLFKPKDTK